MSRVKTACNPTATEHDLRLEGEIDLAAEAEFADALKALMSCDHRDVCVDAATLEFIDSTGLTLLAQLCRIAHQRGGSVRVTGAPNQLSRLVEITKLPVEVDRDPTATCMDD